MADRAATNAHTEIIAMRLFLGLILGIALTVGGAYVTDSTAAAGAKMVNWDVVGKNFESITTFARESFKKITG
jgi:hypothetical protein